MATHSPNNRNLFAKPPWGPAPTELYSVAWLLGWRVGRSLAALSQPPESIRKTSLGTGPPELYSVAWLLGWRNDSLPSCVAFFWGAVISLQPTSWWETSEQHFNPRNTSGAMIHFSGAARSRRELSVRSQS